MSAEGYFYSHRHKDQFTIIDVKSESVFDYIKKITATDGKVLGYEVLENIAYYSTRYNQWITIKKGDKSDGATSAPDINSFCWLIHDDLCNFGVFEDGTKCTNWQASMVLSDLLSEEDKYIRSKTWFVATWLFGGGKARKNGIF